MTQLSSELKEIDGCKFWSLVGDVIECTYDKDFNIQGFYINRIPVTQDDLIVELADEYDNKGTIEEMVEFERSLIDSELSEYAYDEFLEAHSGRL